MHGVPCFEPFQSIGAVLRQCPKYEGKFKQLQAPKKQRKTLAF
jgi:hypothetical protein